MADLYMLQDLMRDGGPGQKRARSYLRYAIAVAFVDQQLRDLRRIRKWMRNHPRRWKYGGPVPVQKR